MSEPIDPLLSPTELFQSWPEVIHAKASHPANSHQEAHTNPSSDHNDLNPVKSNSPLIQNTSDFVRRLHLPIRPLDAKTGSEFWSQVKLMDRFRREKTIQAEILSGNIPDHLRNFKALKLAGKDLSGATITATAYVIPDYLAIGSNQDYVLIPMSAITAQAIADQTQTLLPTRKIVDLIYQQAEIRLPPQKQDSSGLKMISVPYFQAHDLSIQQQRKAAKAQAGQLLAGHKKDVIITNRLDHKPKSVALYGWHQLNGQNLQPLTVQQINTYVDYSHGIRLLAPEIELGGTRYTTLDILKHPVFSELLSDEGPILNARAIRP